MGSAAAETGRLRNVFELYFLSISALFVSVTPRQKFQRESRVTYVVQLYTL